MKNTDKKLTVVIADASPVDAAGIKAVLAKTEFKVAAVCHNAISLSAAVKKAPPDLLLLDASFPDVAHLLPEVSIKTKVLVLAYPNAVKAAAAHMNAGASGLVLKSSPESKLLAAARTVAGGDLFVDGDTGVRFSATPSLDRSLAALGLTARESEILALVVKGRRNLQIAAELGISRRTVDAIRLKIKKKLGGLNSAGLTKYVMESGYAV